VKAPAGIALAALVFAPLAAAGQTEPASHRYQLHRFHGPHHAVHHRFAAHSKTPEPAAAQRGGAVESAPPQTNPIFKPYAHPGEGDDDGLSRDPDDCMKGCIGGNPG
jgi:hypothetical protein